MDFGLSCIILSALERVIVAATELDSRLKNQTITTCKHPFQMILNRLNIASVKDTVLPAG